MTGIPVETMGRESFTKSRLTPNSSYTFRVAGVNVNGTGPFSDVIIINTEEESINTGTNSKLFLLLLFKVKC